MSEPAVREFVRKLPLDTVLISGGAKGVDTWAADEAEKLGIKTVVILPNWKKYGKYAALRRNNEIVLAADDVAAFWDFKSTGTFDTIKKALKHKRNLGVFNAEGQAVEFFDMANLPPDPLMRVPRARDGQ